LGDRLKKEGYKKTLILEDDCQFPETFIDLTNSIYPHIPKYDMLYFGQWNYDKGVIEGEKSALKEVVYTHPKSDGPEYNVYSAQRCWLTHAYAVDLSVIDTLLDNTKNLYGSIDNVLADIQEEKNLTVYAIHPALINQDGTRSSLRP
jgi:GR25 family glycosyltransferase involved in LPS biosynthesis